MDTVPASHLYPSWKPRETQCTWFKKVFGSPVNTHDDTVGDDFMGFTQFRSNHIILPQMPHRQASNHWHNPPHSSEEPTTLQNTTPSPLHQGYSGQLTGQLFPPSLGLGSSSSGGPISQCTLTFWHGHSKQNAHRMAISTITQTVTLCLHFSHCSEPCSTPLCTSRGGALQGLDWCLELLFTHPPCKSCQMIKKNAMR